MGVCGSSSSTSKPISGGTPSSSLATGGAGGGSATTTGALVGAPSLKKQPSQQAIASMTNVLGGRCRFAGTVMEEDNKEIPIASCDGEVKKDGSGPLDLSFVFNVGGGKKWKLIIHVTPTAPRPESEEVCQLSADIASGGSGGDGGSPAVDYRTSGAVEIDVHAMSSLRLIEEVNLKPLSLAAPNSKHILIRGSLSWRLSEADKPVAVITAAPAPAQPPVLPAAAAGAAASPSPAPAAAPASAPL